MARYSFLTRWVVDAPIDRVWEALTDVAAYPQWWKYVARVDLIRPGDEAGVGMVHRTRWTSALPYSLTFETEVLRIEPPHVLKISARGELDGSGLWQLSRTDQGTEVDYRWTVAPTRAWMNVASPLLRPAFTWNHRVVMDEGGEALAQLLGSRITVNTTRALSGR